MIVFKQRGNFNNTDKFFKRMSQRSFLRSLDRYGREGVAALASATPVDSGKTANSWNYEIRRTGSSCSIIWTNSHMNKGVNIAVILQYGHGTRNGGYVQGVDYINPAIKPIFDHIAEEAWKEVTMS